jgi:hypothetical protein
MQAAFALLGEEAAPQLGDTADSQGGGPVQGVSSAAVPWLKKVQINQDQLEEHLHLDGGTVKVISLPGDAAKRIDQVIHTYLMQGLAAFLATGEASFSDKEARELCEHFGCYDHTNHAKYVKEFGNRITGSKKSGWKLTAPGLSAAAELVKS